MRKSPRDAQTARRRILRALEGPGPVLITGHVKPDGDFLGSALGLAGWLESGGRSAVVVSTDGVPSPYGFLPGADRVVKEFTVDAAGRTAVVLDTPSLARTGAPAGYFERAERLINIDHHPDNEDFGDPVLVDPTASSVALLVSEILAPSARPMDAAAATALYTGILTDTGGFRFTNTDSRTLRAAAELAALGARPSETARAVYGSLAPEELKLLGFVLLTPIILVAGTQAGLFGISLWILAVVGIVVFFIMIGFAIYHFEKTWLPVLLVIGGQVWFRQQGGQPVLKQRVESYLKKDSGKKKEKTTAKIKRSDDPDDDDSDDPDDDE